MRYAFVCTNFNNTHFSTTLVESLAAVSLPPEDIVIIDNASSEEHLQPLRDLAARFPSVTAIFNPVNTGYFPGLNTGLQHLHATKKPFDFIIVGNNDLEFPKDFGEKLRDAAANLSAYAVVAPDIVTLDGVRQNPHILRGITNLRETIYDLYFSHFLMAKALTSISQMSSGLLSRKDNQAHQQPAVIRGGIGACYILTRRFFERFEELHAPTFLMGEEYFLTHQIETAGLSMYYEPSLVVKHRCNGALDKLSSHKIWAFGRESHRVRRSYEDRGRLRPWSDSAPTP